MSKLNQHIQEYLNYYCDLEYSPGYAVLIKGKWGSGKTWFIKESVNKLKSQGKKFLHVSVYGISTFDEIENEFFKQLHPLLSSKSFSLTSKIAQGLLKSTLKIDLTNDGKPDININSNIPKIDLPEYLTNTDGYILIFDDLERCSIPIDKLLGYINHFVEIQGYKAIIIANEEEFLQKDTDSKYARIKEKLIGKTFEITPDLDGALNHFISEIQHANLKSFYRSNCGLIKDIHVCSQYSNLRHLKQSLWDFEYFFKNIDQTFQKCEALIQELLQIFLVLSFEIKGAEIISTKISEIKNSYIKDTLNKQETKIDLYSQLKKKYNQINLLNLVLSHELWEEIFDKGIYNKQEIKNALTNSKYFIDKHTPNWIKLWYFSELTDKEFNTLLDTEISKLDNATYKEIGEVKHIIGLLLFFIDDAELKLNKNNLMQKALENIRIIIESQKITTHTDDTDSFFRNSSWNGLGFHHTEDPIFQELCKNIAILIQEHTELSYPSEAQELLHDIKTNIQSFTNKVMFTNQSVGIFHNIPIFHYIKPSNFIEVLGTLPANIKQQINYVFSERYISSSINNNLLTELTWIEQVTTLLKSQILSDDKKLSQLWTNRFINILEKAKENLSIAQELMETKATAPQ